MYYSVLRLVLSMVTVTKTVLTVDKMCQTFYITLFTSVILYLGTKYLNLSSIVGAIKSVPTLRLKA